MFPSPITIWSITLIPRTSPAAISLAVESISAWDGVGSPTGMIVGKNCTYSAQEPFLS